MTDEKIETLMSIYKPLEKQTADKTASTRSNNPDTYTGNVYNDYYFFRWNFVNPMEYAYMYKNYANDVAANAKENMDFYESLGNQYEYQKNADIAARFKGRNVEEFSYTEMFQYYIHYDFSALLVLLICLYALINVFVMEKETEMDILLLTTKAGGLRTTLAKLLSSAMFVCIVCFWFWSIDFVAFSSIFGSLEAIFSPIYVIENFANSSIGVSLGTYAMLSNLVKTAGILVLSLVFLLVSTFFKNALFPFVISMFLAFGVIYTQEMVLGSGRIFLKVVNPFVLVVNRELFRKTEYINLFNYPVISYIPALLFAAAWGTVCILGVFVLVRKNAVHRKGGRKHAINTL
nr:ABC transporter permease [Evansella caseinilytica]